MMPQPSAQHQPTKQKRTVKAWKMPIVKLMMKASNLCSVVTRAENLGAPRHKPSNPLRIVPFSFSRPKILPFTEFIFQTNVIIISPVPGRSPFSIKQIQARPWGRTGRAPLASEVLSTRATGIRSSLLILKIKYFNQPNEIK
jgi:hypothetical protein